MHVLQYFYLNVVLPWISKKKEEIRHLLFVVMFPSKLEGDTLFLPCPSAVHRHTLFLFIVLQVVCHRDFTFNLSAVGQRSRWQRSKIWKLFLLINILLTIYHRKTYMSCDDWSAWVQYPYCFVVSGSKVRVSWSKVMVGGSSSRSQGSKMLICYRSLSHKLFVTETSYIMGLFLSGHRVKGKGRRGKW